MDVAADLGHTPEYNHSFWKKFRKVVKEANPNAIILAEHYGDPKPWLRGDEWDTVMNYDAFMEPLTWFLTGMEKHSDEYRPELVGDDGHFVYSMVHNMSRYLTPSLQVAMNELSNHDHSRFLTRTNHAAGRVNKLGSKAADENVDVSVMREAVVMQMTWVGAPTLYYGDEAGVCGFTDPDNRRTYPWGNEDQELIDFHREMIRIHKESEAFRTGSLKILGTKRDVLSYARFQGEDRYVVVVNNGDKEQEVTIPVWQAEVPEDGTMTQIAYTDADGYSVEAKEYPVVNGTVRIKLGVHCAAVLKG
jgi:alpha-glucosidase